jgi:hypothetical protein
MDASSWVVWKDNRGMQAQVAVYTICEVVRQFELNGHWCQLSREHRHWRRRAPGAGSNATLMEWCQAGNHGSRSRVDRASGGALAGRWCIEAAFSWARHGVATDPDKKKQLVSESHIAVGQNAKLHQRRQACECQFG